MKAIVLFSGGLDSSLAVKVIQRQNIEAIPLHFLTPFSKCNSVDALKPWLDKSSKILNTQVIAFYLGDEYLAMLTNPKHGFGKNINPCIDCKILMLKKAKELMGQLGASFLITGEVLGQRPMSQHKDALGVIERDAGVEGILVRPLSGKLLPATIPETKGWINREGLLDFSGRARGPQINLAREIGLSEYPWPGSGCLLTDPSSCGRVEDLMRYKQLTIENINLLKSGRHFRLSESFKLIVGRNKEGNDKLVSQATKDHIIIEPSKLHGPTALGIGVASKEIIRLACQIVARYTDSISANVEVTIKQDATVQYLTVEKLADVKVRELIV